MKRLLLLPLLAFTLACGASPTAPSTAALTRVGVQKATAPVMDTSVRWYRDMPGLVTVTNTTSAPLTLTFALSNRVTEFNQRVVATALRTIPPGETADLTVGGTTEAMVACQADLYVGVHHVGDTLSEVGNYLYAGNAQLFAASACSSRVLPPPPGVPPTVVPPVVVPVCLDLEANNYRQPGPCSYPPPVAKCTDRNADNYGKALPCVYPVPCPIPGKKS